MKSTLQILLEIIEKAGKNRDREFVSFNDLLNIAYDARREEIIQEDERRELNKDAIDS